MSRQMLHVQNEQKGRKKPHGKTLQSVNSAKMEPTCYIIIVIIVEQNRLNSSCQTQADNGENKCHTETLQHCRKRLKGGFLIGQHCFNIYCL